MSSRESDHVGNQSISVSAGSVSVRFLPLSPARSNIIGRRTFGSRQSVLPTGKGSGTKELSSQVLMWNVRLCRALLLLWFVTMAASSSVRFIFYFFLFFAPWKSYWESICESR